MFESVQLTAADTAVAADIYNDEITLTLLGGNDEDNVDINGTYADVEALLSDALREIRKYR